MGATGEHLRPLVPAQAGTQRDEVGRRPAASAEIEPRGSWIPACAGMSGEGRV